MTSLRSGRAGARPALILVAALPLLLGAAVPRAQEPEPAFQGAKPVAIFGEHLDGTPFKRPQGIFFDVEHDEIFVADSGNGLIGIFDGRGVPKYTFAPESRRAHPMDMATDRDGNIYVVSAGSKLVKIFSYRGEPIGEIDVGLVRGAKGTPSSVAVSPDGLIYVLDALGGRILVYDREGDLRSVITGSGRGGGRLQAPMRITLGPDGNLYVTDARGISVQVYSPEGRYLRGWGRRGMGPGTFSVAGGIAVDGSGRIYVTDIQRQEIKVYDASGQPLGSFGGMGGAPGQLGYPGDIAAGRERVYVVERVGRRVQIFEPLTPPGEGDVAPGESPLPER